MECLKRKHRRLLKADVGRSPLPLELRIDSSSGASFSSLLLLWLLPKGMLVAAAG